MSRCFPYPPPGYTLSRASQEALIESIKLQKEREKTEEQRQKKREEERKKEKKEKRKEKKDKKKEKKDKTHQNLYNSDIRHGKSGQKFWTDTKGGLLHKGCEAEPEQLERSSLTEEHGKPVSLRVPSSSSDSTENSNKRKRDSLPIDSTRGHGKIIRIRLSKRPNPSDASANEQQVCSTSGRAPVPSQNKDDILRLRSGDFCSTSDGIGNTVEALALRNNREQALQKIETVATRKTIIPSVSDAAMTPMQRAALQYKNLIENWVPPQLSDVSIDGDSDWLFNGRNQERRVAEERSISENDGISCSSSATSWPSAQYLRKVDMYALPFTVPF